MIRGRSDEALKRPGGVVEDLGRGEGERGKGEEEEEEEARVGVSTKVAVFGKGRNIGSGCSMVGC